MISSSQEIVRMQGRKISRIFLFLLLSYLEHHQVNGSEDEHSKYLNSANLITSNCSSICKSNYSNHSNHPNHSSDSINVGSRLLRLIADTSAADPHNVRFRRAVTSRPERKWHNAIIPYEIEPNKFTGNFSVF